VISPGVPWDLPQLQAARERGIPIYPEVEAASWFLEGTLVGVTGSNGKTTTTLLLGDMLKASGFPTFVGGNIGNALSQAVDHAQPDTKFVTELSSFQLEGIHEFRPHVAVMLNLSPNHLDRHPSLEAYAQAKRQIFRNQSGQDYAVLNADDPWVAGLRETVPSHPVLFSRHRELASGVFVSGGKICYRVRHLERVLFETSDVTLRGDFNLEDVLAATTAACVLGADFAAIRKAVRAFQAVEHRLEFVRQIQGVDFYNNSKATSVDATLKSLEAFAGGVHLIMGGKDKGAPYTPLLPLIKERVREVLLIGAAAPVIAEQLAGATDLVQAGDLATAVYEAFTRARPGDTVLLAPACSSFDQFKDYEERGRVFKKLVNGLAKDVGAGQVVRSPNSGLRIPESGIRNLESGILNQESEIRSPESRVHGLESEVQGAAPGSREAGVWRPESGVSSLESGILNLESGVSKAARPMPPVPTPADEAAPAEPDKAPLPPDPDRSAESGSSAAALQSASRTSTDKASPQSAESEMGVTPLPEGQGQAPPVLGPPTSHPESGGTHPQARVLSPESRVPSEESRVPYPASRVPCPVSRAVPSPVSRAVPSPVPRVVPLTYVYEVDAVEMPGSEPQVLPEDEPEVSISADRVVALDDEVLPFEVRQQTFGGKGESGVRSPKSEVKGKSKIRTPKSKTPSPLPEVDGKSEAQSPWSEAQPTDSDTKPNLQQPRLFNGSDK
jgi:UDP-N-acetylmuramoylalanine--D-glutamate ligase